MEGGSDIAQRFFNWVYETMAPKMSGAVAEITELVAIVMAPAVVLWFVLWAIRYLKEEQPVTDLLWHFFRLAVVASFAANATYYSSHIVPMVNGIPDDIASVFVGDGENPVNIIDGMIDVNAAAISQIWEESKLMRWSGIQVDNLVNASVASVVVGVLGGIYTGIALLLLFISKVLLSVVLSLGPIFIACAFFPALNSFFTAWTGQLVNYTLLAVLLAAVFALMHSLVGDIITVDLTDGGLSDQAVVEIFVVYIVAIGTIVLMPMVAAGLAGGVALNGILGGTTGAASMLVGKPFFATLGRLAKALKNGSNNQGNNLISGGKGTRLPG